MATIATSRWLPRALLASVVTLVLAHWLLFALAAPAPLPEDVGFAATWVVVLFAISFSAVGALVATRLPGNAIGWLFLAEGLLWSVMIFGQAVAAWALVAEEGPRALGEVGAWAHGWLWFPVVALPATLLLLLFPDGKPPSRRWRRVLFASLAGIIGGTVGLALGPGRDETFALENPFGLPGPAGKVATVLGVAGVLLTVVCCVASGTAMVIRFRRSRGDVRQQLKWFALAAGLLAVVFPLSFALWDVASWAPILLGLAIVALPFAAGVGILRHGLFDIDLLINRALVYGTLAAAIAALYAGVVVAFAAAFRVGTGLWPSVVAAAVAVALVQPLRAGLQRWVNRLLYGERDDPYAVVARLGRRLELSLAPDDVLPTVVESVAGALKLPYVAIELERDGAFEAAASFGERGHIEPLVLPLVHQGRDVGRLLVSRRSHAEELSARDLRLLEDLARQAGAAVYAVRLTIELQRSRERIVAAREEERRRIRRDLHDGLGPALAALALKLDLARALVDDDPEAARELLAELRAEAQSAIGDIRRLVYDLRPAALDELGLVGALRERATSLGAVVEAPVALPPLPAAVEVAAYRIALEAMTNAARHSGASSCALRISVNGGLELEVSDDGSGVPLDAGPGVGLASMRERAAELGGSCIVESVPGEGTVIRARLPLSTT